MWNVYLIELIFSGVRGIWSIDPKISEKTPGMVSEEKEYKPNLKQLDLDYCQ